MRAPLYNQVHLLALDIVNASSVDDEKLMMKAYKSLKLVCKNHEDSDEDHPLQWEALGDFSDTNEDAINAYEKGLLLAKKLELPEYLVSIKFSMAENYLEQRNIERAKKYAQEAYDEISCTDDEELKRSIKELLHGIKNT